jgi:hypothetical protein
MPRDIKYTDAEESIKSLTPSQWDKLNASKGYLPHPGYAAGKRKTDQYKEYYNPLVFSPNLTEDGAYQWKNLNDPNYDFSNPINTPVEKYTAPRAKQIPEISPTTKPIQFTPDYAYNPNSGIIKTNNGQLIDPAIPTYKKGGLVGKVKKYATGGPVLTKDQKLTGINLAGQGLNAVGGPEDTSLKYGSNPYFDQRNTDMAAGQGVANAAGAIPIVGAFKALGEGAQNAIAKKDAYGVSDSSDIAVGAGGFLNPLESTTSAFGDIKSGKITGKTAANLLLPGVGAILNNKENKKNRNALMAGKVTEEEQALNDAKFNTSLAKQLASRNNYSKGGKIVGTGTGTSDSINAKVEAGSHIIPKKNAKLAQAIRKEILNEPKEKEADIKQSGESDVKLSNGEHMFSPEEVAEIEAHGIDLDDLSPDAEHGEDEMSKGGLTAAKAKIILHDGTIRGKAITDKQRKFFGAVSNGYKCGGMVKGYAKGGTVDGEDPFKIARERAIADSRDADLAERKALLEEFKMIKDKRNSSNPVDRFTYNKRLPEIGARLKQINEKHGLTNKEIPSKTGAEIDRLTKQSSTAPRSGLASKTASKLPTLAQSSLANSMGSQDASNLVQPPPVTITPTSSTVNKNAIDNTNSAIDPNLASYDRDLAARQNELNGANTGNVNRNTGIKNGLSSLINYGIPLAQAGIGLNFLKKAGPRPVDSIDPEFTTALTNARTRASYGFTPEEQAVINNQNNNLTSAQRFAARNYSGGSPGNAYNMERNAINDSYGRGLKSALANRTLQLGKQQYADELGLNKVELSRRLFNDKMQAWQQNQSAAAGLLNSGLSNLVGANRYEQEKDAIAQNQAISNSWINGLGQ